MNCCAWHLVIFLLAGLAIGVQAGQKTDPGSPQGPPPQPEGRPTLGPQEERPTLGPRNGPGPDSGPNTSTTIDVRKLMRIHTLYIENIDNSLSDKLIATIGNWRRFRLVTKARDADATLGGSCLESRRLKHVHSEIYISDRNGASIWQDSIYRPFYPPALDQAVSETAAVVEAHLAQAMREGDRR